MPPADFLPIIEDSDFEITLSQWVMRTAFEQTAAWHQNGLDLQISVNLPARHLQSDEFLPFVRQLLASYPSLPVGRFELEILETAALGDLLAMSQKMDACRALGLRFALDDFGTGYASLAYLKRLPASIIKIDQSFVIDMLLDANDLAIVEAVIGLGAAFDTPVIAEGVETIEHGVLLLHLGCNLAQGYGIAHPMPAASLPIWANSWQPNTTFARATGKILTRQNLPLAQMATQHRAWLASLENQITAETPCFDAFHLTRDSCVFGRWCDGHGQETYGRLPEFARVNALHDAIHTLAVEFAGLACAGDKAAAGTALTDLHGLREQLLGAIEVLIDRVAVEEAGRRFGAGSVNAGA